jgi:2,4-dienoyl-CoA reductase-like NADH-dependent reductase (Old Yellow Enzyme family)
MEPKYSHLLSSFDYGFSQMPTSIVMAPMTRCRADCQGIPTEEMVQFYKARARNILVIGEATYVSQGGRSYENRETHVYPPGLCNQEQASGWRRVADAVHEVGGCFFLQLWHAGPMGHSAFREGALPLAPSAVAPLKQFVPRSEEKLIYEVPKPMEDKDFESTKQSFVQAAILAVKEANCDGVELHAASGYLLNSFLTASTNQRQDQYGGSPENRSRFVLEVVDAVVEAVAKIKEGKRVGIRLSPVPLVSMKNVLESPEDQETFRYLLSELNKRSLVYVHVSSDHDADKKHQGLLGKKPSAFVREHYQGTVIGGGSYTIEEAEGALKQKEFDLVYFGRSFIANPRLLEAIEKGQSSQDLKPYDSSMLKNTPV